jgi:hypothetical protein
VKRILLLIGLISMLAWLVPPDEVLRAAATTPPGSTAAQAGETDPYYVCAGYLCVEQEGCGTSTCQSNADCDPCDPAERAACLEAEREWHDETCSCSQPACNESEVLQCAANWGSWDESTCSCSNECNPGAPQLVYVAWSPGVFLGCVDCGWGLFYDLWEWYFEQYCEDGRLRDAYWDLDFYYYETWDWSCWEWYCEEGDW